MIHRKRYLQAGLILAVLALGLWTSLPTEPAGGQEAPEPEQNPSLSITGRLLDPQGRPVDEAEVAVYVVGQDEPIGHTISHEANGTFVVDLPGDLPQGLLRVEVERPHFECYETLLSVETRADLRHSSTIRLPDITLTRRVTLGFWFATFGFAGILVLLALEKLHNTTAILLGATSILMFSYLGSAINEDQCYIFDLERAIFYIDFDVIFLVMGMMIVVGIMEGTGIFQWMAFMAYRLSRGRITVLVVILVIITAVASALLHNVTTMLLMAPITLQIALALGINPHALIIPEVLASDVGGIATLIGAPTNVMIGSYADIGFNNFLFNVMPGSVLAQIALIVYVQWLYRAEYRKVDQGISPALYAKLEENAKIKDPNTLRKALIVFGSMLLFFALGDLLYMAPSMVALAGATVFLVWVEADVERMLKAVDWTTLVFFMALFMAVGAVREVGMVGFIAEFLEGVIGGDLLLGMIILVWSAAFLSMVIASESLTATMLPVVGFLSGTLDASGSKVLFYGLSVGSGMGGNGSLIGASANLLSAGILDRAGYPISYRGFMRIGLPSMIVTTSVGIIWLVFRFFVL